MKESDLIIDDSDKIKKKPLELEEDAKRKRSKWIKWLLRIIDSIVTFFS